MTNNDSIEKVYDTINTLIDNNEKLEKDNLNHENLIVNNKKSIEISNQQIEKIMKDLIEGGGFQIDEMLELKILTKLINNSSGEFEKHKNSMIKCIEFMADFANKYLEIYRKQNEEEEKVVSQEEKLNELLQMSKEDLVDLCKEHDLSHTGSKKKLAERLISIYEF